MDDRGYRRPLGDLDLDPHSPVLPRREEIEFSEFLVETDRFVQHPLLGVVVAHLDEAGERKILAQRMALETVVGQQPPHVGMADEDHAIEVVGLALEPVGARKYIDDRRHLRGFVGLRAQADARVQRRRQKMVDHVEPLLAFGMIDRRHVGEIDETQRRIVAEEFHDLDDPVSRQVGQVNDQGAVIGPLMHRPRRCLIGKQRSEQFGTAMDPESLIDDATMSDSRVLADAKPGGNIFVG